MTRSRDLANLADGVEFLAADHTKLDGIEASADVTDTANVTAAGALMDSELTNLAAVKAINQSLVTTASPTFAGLATTANVTFADNDKAIFGAGSDLQIYHNTTGFTGNIIESSGANLYIRSDNLYLQKGDGTENNVIAISDGAVTLSFNNAAKLATTATGINVTGQATLTSGQLNFAGSISDPNGAAYIWRPADNTLAFGTANEERLRITSAGLHQFKGELETANETMVMRFRDASENFKAGIQAVNSNGQMVGSSAAGDFAIRSQSNMLFSTGGNTERMRIVTGGEVGINCTPQSSTFLDVKGRFKVRRNVAVGHASEGNWDFNLSHESSAVYGTLYLTPSVSTAELDVMGGKLRVKNNGDVSIGDGNLVIGTAGHGIDFSAYGAGTNIDNNLLNDYEEGTWTPTIQGDGAVSGQSYSGRTAVYTKIGSFVFLTFDVSVSALGTTAGAYANVKGLPFSVVTSHLGGGSVGYHTGINNTSGVLTFYASGNQAYIMKGGNNYVPRSDLTNGSRLIATIIYQTGQ